MNVAASESVRETSQKWKPYPDYKDSGIEWLGAIPTHWELRKLKYGSELNMGQSPRSTDCNTDGEGLPFLQGNAEFGERHPIARLWCDVSPKCACVGDYLLSVRAPVGAVNVAEQEYGIGRGLCAISFRNSLVEHRFGWYLLCISRQDLNRMTTGSTFEAVSVEDVGNVSCFVPPLSEQCTIALFLDREAAKIDALISAKERQIAILREKRTAVITQAVMHGVDTNVAFRDSGVEWLGLVPSHWDVRRNKTIFVEVDERSKTDSEELLTVSHITGVTPRAEKRGVNMFLAETTEGYKTCQVDDLVINTMWAWMGALGFTNYAGVVSPSYHVYRLRSTDRLLTEYLDLLYRTSAHLCEIMRYSRGIWTSRLRLYPEEFLGMRTPVPPVDEQKRICEYIEAETELIDGVIDANIRHIELLRERRTALISAAVTGQIDVRGEV